MRLEPEAMFCRFTVHAVSVVKFVPLYLEAVWLRMAAAPELTVRVITEMSPEDATTGIGV